MRATLRKSLFAFGILTIACSSGDIAGISDSTATQFNNTPQSVVITPPTSATLIVGTAISLTAAVKNATGADISGLAITWSSSDNTVASVSATGILTAVKAGTTTITASVAGKSASVTLTVINVPVKAVSVSVRSVLLPGDTATASVAPADSVGAPLALAGRTITWTSSNTAIATVSSTGVVNAVAPGSSSITGTVDGIQGAATVTVGPAPVAVVTLTWSGALLITQSTSVTAVLKDAQGNVLSGRVIAWSSSNPSVATVNASGSITGVSLGTAVITATSEGVSSTLPIIVSQAGGVASVSVAAPSTALQPTQTTQAAATLRDALNAVVAGNVTWSTSAAGVATVSSAGLITGIASGTAVITATSGIVSGQITIAVPPVATVNLTTSNANLLAAQTTQVTVSLLDAQGHATVNRAVTWSSATPAVATVTQAGVVTAVAQGTSVISVTSEGKTGTITITCVPPVGSIIVTSTANSLSFGQTSQLTAQILDTFGKPVTNVTPTWTTSDATKGTVSSAGVVTAINKSTQASVTFTASAGGVTATAPIAITGHASETLAALPQVFLNTTAPPAPDVGGAVIVANNSAQFINALNTANYGDVIELANGVTFTGNFNLPLKGANNGKWITIRPVDMSGVPAEGNRMTQSVAAGANLPILLSPTNGGAIQTVLGAHHYRIIGLEISITANNPGNTGLIRFGDGGGGGQVSVATTAHDLVIDRCYIHGIAGAPNQIPNLRRAVAMNSASSAVVDSWIGEVHDAGSDAQAIAGWNGPGPYKIVNNYLEASTEILSWGGTDPDAPNVIPTDIEVRHNHFSRPESWKGVWAVKNLIESKASVRMLVEGNLFENHWADAQSGSFANFKSTDQSGGCPWCGTQDLTFRYNLVRNVSAGFNLSAAPDPNITNFPLQRVTITDNVIANIDQGVNNGGGWGTQINTNPSDITIKHNTIISPSTFTIVFGGGSPPIRFTYRDNIVGTGLYGVKGPGITSGNTTINQFFPEGYWFGNALIIASSSGYPTQSLYFTSTTPLNFVNPANFDYTLGSGSPLIGKGTDGLDVGANMALVSAAIANVIVP